MNIRKILSYVEDGYLEAGKPVDPAVRRVAVVAICPNPLAGRFEEDLTPLIDGSAEVGRRISKIGAGLMQEYGIESYGKGAVVGINGEVEHAEAVLTTVFGDAMRDAVGGGKAWICHMAKIGGPGVTIDIPLAHKDALTVRSHYDAMTLTLQKAPSPDEIALIVCFANRSRPNHRIGGHRVDHIIGKDGLR